MIPVFEGAKAFNALDRPATVVGTFIIMMMNLSKLSSVELVV
jgi:hypothetical protein